MTTMVSCFCLCSCFFEDSNNAPSNSPAKKLAYSVKVSSQSGALRCSVFVKIENWPEAEPVVFQLPPYYPDNPRMPVPGVVSSRIHIEDAKGQSLSSTPTTAPFNQGGGVWITLPSSATTVSYEIDLDPADSTRFGVPIPGLKHGVQLLDGALLFILPAMGNSLSSHWRNPISLSLNWHIPGGNRLMGDSVLNLACNYQLMFYRGVLNPSSSLEFQVGNHQVTVYTTEAVDTLDLQGLAQRMNRWIPLVESHFSSLPWKHLWIGSNINSVYGGLEGIGGYWFGTPYGSHAEVHLHEFTHSIVGVLLGEYDDAWFKEGVTEYFGLVMAVQDGFYTDTVEVRSYLQNLHDSVPSVIQYALSDEVLRDRFYHDVDTDYVERPPQDFYSLLYGKGAEAAMQIDAWLLQNSAGKHDLFEAVRTLYNAGAPAFTRQQLNGVLQNLSGQRADTLLQSLCDKPGPYTVVQLQRAFSTLRTYDRFHASSYTGVMAKRTAVSKSGFRKIPEKI